MASKLSKNIIDFLAEKLSKTHSQIRPRLSEIRRVNSGLTPNAAAQVYALNHGTSIMAKLDQEDRQSLAFTQFNTKSVAGTDNRNVGSSPSLVASTRYVDLLEIIQDVQLKDRCTDLIKRPRNHDRVFREATTILEDRIKKLSGIKTRLNPQSLISKAVSPDPNKAILVVSNENAEQEGFYKICSGIEASFRNRTHHEVSDKMSRFDAIKFCSFIDSLLLILDEAEVHKDRV